MIVQSTQGRARRVVERLPGFVGCEFASDGYLPHPMDDAEVASQQVPSQEEVVLEAPQGDLPDSRREGDRTPKGTAPERSMVPNSGRQPPSKRSKPTELVTSVQPEAPDNLLEVLNGASSTRNTALL